MKKRWIRLILSVFLVLSLVPAGIPGMQAEGAAAEAPTITALYNGASGLVLKWRAAANADGYRVWCSYPGTDAATCVADVAADAPLCYTDLYASNGTKYTFRVEAYTAADSVYSAEKSLVRLGCPSNVSVTSVKNGLALSWEPVSNAGGYFLYRSKDGGKTYRQLAAVKSRTTGYRDTTVKNGVCYRYKIKAYRTADGVTYTGAFSAAKKRCCLSRPAVSALTCPGVGKVRVTWNRNRKATGYQLYISYDADFRSVRAYRITANKTVSKTVTGLYGGVRLYVKVRSYKTVNKAKYYSLWSARKYRTVKRATAADLVPLSKLKNLAELRAKCTDTQLRQAYKAAKKIVLPLVGLDRRDQLCCIANELRYMVMSGKVTYSMSAAHYNDPYGYFIKGVGSCSGCTRATGLCLNMLGIAYEHVNAHLYSHQWARVKVGKKHWICDAYGAYVGVEPAPYKHPFLS